MSETQDTAPGLAAPAQLDDFFSKLVDHLMLDARAQSTAMFNSSALPWCHYQGNVAEVDKRSAVDEAIFNRKKITDEYIKLYTDQPTAWMGAIAALCWILQHDWIAAQNRDFYARHRSRIRLIAHEAVRRSAFGSAEGPFENTVRRWAKLQLNRQTVKPRTPNWISNG